MFLHSCRVKRDNKNFFVIIYAKGGVSSLPGTIHAIQRDSTGYGATYTACRHRDIRIVHKVEYGWQVNDISPKVEPLLY